MYPYAASLNIRALVEAMIRGCAGSNGLDGGPSRPLFERVLRLAVFLGGCHVRVHSGCPGRRTLNP